MSQELNNPKVLRAWTFYDWANSVYSLSIASAIFPAFYEEFTPKQVDILGFSIKNTALYSYGLSLAFLIIVAIVPLLSGIADSRGVKKPYMRFFVALGSLGCSALFWFNGSNIFFGLACFMLATIGWGASLVFYNAYLPEIASPDRFDRLSARGYTMGYIGSVLLLILNLMFIMKPDWFGLPSPKESSLAFRIGFLTVGIWWMGWSLYPLWVLPKDKKNNTQTPLWKGYHELKQVFLNLKQMPQTQRYLAAFFVYTMGVQTVIYVAALFGKNVLELESKDMIITILLIQLIGIAGAYFFAWLADKKGNRFSLSASLFVWVLVCILAYFLEPRKPLQFFGLACLVGTVMGGVQSLSRATYAKLIPGDKDNTSYFSFYEVAEKLAIVLGTLCWGLIDNISGDMRNSILLLMVFFLVGIVLMRRVNSPKLAPKH